MAALLAVACGDDERAYGSGGDGDAPRADARQILFFCMFHSELGCGWAGIWGYGGDEAEFPVFGLRIFVEPGGEGLTTRLDVVSRPGEPDELVVMDQNLSMTFDPDGAVRGRSQVETTIDLCAPGMDDGASTALDVLIEDAVGNIVASLLETPVVDCFGTACDTVCDGR